MELSKQVTSIEISKRLKELGVKQESYFYWLNPFKYQGFEIIQHYEWARNNHHEFYSAFTCSELVMLLPIRVNSGKRKSPKNTYYCNWDFKKGVHHSENAETLADAMGLMLIYLLENKLLTL